MIDQTRRNWLVTIGQAAVSVGLSGSMRARTVQLPEGVYLPSTDHLGHALMSTERFHPVVPGCPTDYVRPRTGPFQPLFFTQSEFAMITRLTRVMLGELSTTDEKNSLTVHQEVAEWIDLRARNAGAVREAALRINPLYRTLSVAYHGPSRVNQLETSDLASTCREGLAWINDEAKIRHAKDFMSLQTAQQIAMLEAVGDERVDKQSQNPGTKLFDLLKAEAIRGFYTSRAGLKELDFKGNAFYAQSPGCRSK